MAQPRRDVKLLPCTSTSFLAVLASLILAPLATFAAGNESSGPPPAHPHPPLAQPPPLDPEHRPDPAQRPNPAHRPDPEHRPGDMPPPKGPHPNRRDGMNPGDRPAEPPEGKPPGPEGVMPDYMRKKLENLPPDRRRQFMKNYRDWQDLSPEQKEAMRTRAREHRERMQKDLEEAIAAVGPDLPEGTREAFIKAYEERRTELERKLREQLEHDRNEGIRKILEDLKKEYSQPGSSETEGSPADAPAGSPTPTATP